MDTLPFSQACENNKAYILEVLHRHLAGVDFTLEIGSGTGQHGEFFASQLPQLVWQTSDLEDNLPGLNLRLSAADLPNLPQAIPLDVNRRDWGCGEVPAVFSANSLHIMGWKSVISFFRGLENHLDRNGLFIVYGPFKYDGDFTSPSNKDFDDWLKSRDPESGIRDFESVAQLATRSGLVLVEDNPMPANNQLLVWRKTAAKPR